MPMSAKAVSNAALFGDACCGHVWHICVGSGAHGTGSAVCQKLLAAHPETQPLYVIEERWARQDLNLRPMDFSALSGTIQEWPLV
jgi:hypothetical protein